MKARLLALMARIDAMAARERVLVFAASAVILAGLLYTFLVAPAQQRLTQLDREAESTAAQVRELQIQLDALARRAEADPDEDNRRALARLREEMTSVDAELRERTLEFISPAQMTRVVEDLVTRTEGLSLLSLQSELPVLAEGLVERPEGDETDAPRIYRHGLSVELSGSYHGVLAYTQALEALPWKLFWDELELVTETYPTARVRLRVYTLSLNEAWIGV
ncbi:MAG: type II secretion system protein M [Gammaproteobacteria bacterium]|nr:type II secretion system protein M [Gammaproteobacteria bacterium]